MTASSTWSAQTRTKERLRRHAIRLHPAPSMGSHRGDLAGNKHPHYFRQDRPDGGIMRVIVVKRFVMMLRCRSV